MEQNELLMQEAAGEIPSEESTMKQPKTGKKKWLAAGIAAGLILIAAVVGILIYLKNSGQEAYEEFTEQLFKDEIVLNTINLHYTLAYPENFGITDYEVSLGSYSVEDFQESYDDMKQLKKQMRKFRRGSLSEEYRVSYDIIMDYLDTELAAEDFQYYAETLSPTTGYQAQLPVILAEYTFRTKQDIEDYLALAAMVDDIAGEIITYEEQKSAAGLFMADYVADGVIDQCRDFIENPDENYMLEVFDSKIDGFEGLTEAEKQAYKERNREVVTGDVVAGYNTLIEGLTKLKGTGKNELGLCYFDKGKEYYEYLVRTSTGCDDSIKKMERRVERFMTDYFILLQEHIMEDEALYDELLFYEFPDMQPEEMMEDLMRKAKEDFPEPPAVNYTIKQVHPSMQESMSPAFYLTTPIDDLEHNVIYINQKHLSEGGSMDLYPTMAHEGYPGHLYQNIYTGTANLPLVRNLFSFPGYTEGWATYVEYEYSYGFSGARTPIDRLLSGNTALSLAISAYLDMKVNYDGWNTEEVLAYLTDFGLGDQETAQEIFESVASEPANYLSYFIGYLEFLDLRETAERKLGDAFEAKEFHDFLLKMGPAPFYIIEEYMNDTIKAVKAGK
ncbi:MAG: DUF885 domain-containing protein [Lachnospiraceae bacterium]|nr:DUF885 domain-containing protein [Lachnospiraceae bacterium]